METKLKIFKLKTFMKLPGLPRLGLHDQVLLDDGLDLFFRSDFGDIFPDINERSIEFEFVI
jgi:hypothetical protein